MDLDSGLPVTRGEDRHDDDGDNGGSGSGDAKCSKCYNRGIHRGLQEYGCEVLDSAWFESGKAMASQFGSLRSKCQERIRHMRDYWGEGV